MTDRQLEILEFLRAYQRRWHMPPTLREVCTEFSFGSTNAAYDHLTRLARKGLVVHRKGCARGFVARGPLATGEVA